jgi:hypothetical protein
MKCVVIIIPVTAIISFTIINTGIKLLFVCVLTRQHVAYYKTGCKTILKRQRTKHLMMMMMMMMEEEEEEEEEEEARGGNVTIL